MSRRKIFLWLFCFIIFFGSTLTTVTANTALNFTCSNNPSDFKLFDAAKDNSGSDLSIDGTTASADETVISGGWNEGAGFYEDDGALFDNSTMAIQGVSGGALRQYNSFAQDTTIREVWLFFDNTSITAAGTEFAYRWATGGAWTCFGINNDDSTTNYSHSIFGSVNCDFTDGWNVSTIPRTTGWHKFERYRDDNANVCWGAIDNEVMFNDTCALTGDTNHPQIFQQSPHWYMDEHRVWGGVSAKSNCTGYTDTGGAAPPPPDTNPPEQIRTTDLKNLSQTNSSIFINFTVEHDFDINHSRVYANGILQESSVNRSFNITGLVQNTTYRIDVQSADNMSNYNITLNATITVVTDPSPPPPQINYTDWKHNLTELDEFVFDQVTDELQNQTYHFTLTNHLNSSRLEYFFGFENNVSDIGWTNTVDTTNTSNALCQTNDCIQFRRGQTPVSSLNRTFYFGKTTMLSFYLNYSDIVVPGEAQFVMRVNGSVLYNSSTLGQINLDLSNVSGLSNIQFETDDMGAGTKFFYFDNLRINSTPYVTFFLNKTEIEPLNVFEGKNNITYNVSKIIPLAESNNSIINFTIFYSLGNDTLLHFNRSHQVVYSVFPIIPNFPDKGIETQTFLRILNLTDTYGRVVVNSSIVFNGTVQFGTFVTSTTVNYTLDLGIHSNATDSNNATLLGEYRLNITFDGRNSIRSIPFNITRYRITLKNCSEGTGVPTLRFFYKDDVNRLNLTQNVSHDSTFRLHYLNNTFWRNHSFNFDDQRETRLCIEPSWASYQAEGLIDYTAPDYTTKTFFFNNLKINNISRTINLYLLNSSDATAVLIQLRDLDNAPVEGATIKVLRYYVSSDTFETVEVLESSTAGGSIDIAGEAVSQAIELDTVFYKFIVEKDGNIILQTDKFKVSRTTLKLIVNIGLDLFNLFNKEGSISSSLSYSNTTGDISFTYSDSNNIVSTGNLLVQKKTFRGTTTICDTTVESTAATITCAVGTNVTGLFIAVGSVDVIGNFTELTLGTLEINQLKLAEKFGLSGLFLTVFIIATGAVLGTMNPAFGAVFVVLGFTISWFIGLVTISFTAIIMLILLGGIVTIFVSRRGA